MRQGRRYLWGTAVAATAIAIVAAAPAAASRRGCEKAVGSTKLANDHSVSSKGIVLRKGSTLWSCAFRKSRANELPGQDSNSRIDRGSVVVRGPYAAYGSKYEGGDHVNTIVFSVKLGNEESWADSFDVKDYGQDVKLDKLQLRPNGSIVWMFEWPNGDDTVRGNYSVVLGFDHGSDGVGDPVYHRYDSDYEDEEDTDPLNPIVQGSLRLKHDKVGETGWAIRWSRAKNASARVDVF
jgi:hypothetical protein